MFLEGVWPPCMIYLNVASIVLLIGHYVANHISLCILGNMKSKVFLHSKYLRNWKNRVRVQMRMMLHSGGFCVPRYVALFLISIVTLRFVCSFTLRNTVLHLVP
jgi:hypothetical protein